jgi:regulator of nucleoside diphosphate kinase
MTMTPIVMTHEDHRRLTALLDQIPRDDRRHFQDLRRELRRAERVEPSAIAGDVITMDSTVLLRETKSGDRWTFTLCYPEDADVSRNRISILSPVGTAIIGFRVGDVVDWPVPGGTVEIVIEAIEYQPEAAGAFSTSGA